MGVFRLAIPSCTSSVPNEVGIDLAWSCFDGCNSPYKAERVADRGATNLLSCTQIYHFNPHNLTSILLEHLLLRSDPVLSQVLPFYILRDDFYVCVTTHSRLACPRVGTHKGKKVDL
jgi:hypothetical protein